MDGDLVIDFDRAFEPMRRCPYRAAFRLRALAVTAAVVLSGCGGIEPPAGAGSRLAEVASSASSSSSSSAQAVGPPSAEPSAMPDDGLELQVVSVDGVPYTDGRRWPEVDEVGSFTVTATGVVYVDTALRIVWEDRSGARRVLGQQPWHLAESREMFLRYRDLIGNPEQDLVAWVETDGGQPGDLVVMQPSTGRVLARTPVPEPDQALTLASLDHERLYFSASPQGQAFEITAPRVYEWHWPTDEPPRLALKRGNGVLDVTAGIWAVDAGPVMRFEDDSGRMLTELPISSSERAYFGYGLSPDGRFWFDGDFVVTATGERRPLRGPTNGGSGRFGWIDADTFAFANRDGLHTCESDTGACTPSALKVERSFVGPGMGPGEPPPPGIDADDVCFEEREAKVTRCGYDLPIL